MPGAIHVSIIDFSGDDLSPTNSHFSIKVSLGGSEFETHEQGQVSFPLKNMRDNLIVTVQDKEGNKVSCARIEPRLVIEKRVWDNVLTLEGGWQVHLKLQFVLSEGDRYKIRATRESALKQKHEELLQRNPRGSDFTTLAAGILIRPKHEISENVTNSVSRDNQSQARKAYLPVDANNNEANASSKIRMHLPDKSGISVVTDAYETKDEHEIESAAATHLESDSRPMFVSNSDSEERAKTVDSDERGFVETVCQLEEGTKKGLKSIIETSHREDQSIFINDKRSSVSGREPESFADSNDSQIKQCDLKLPVCNGVWIFPDEGQHFCITVSKAKSRVAKDFGADENKQYTDEITEESTFFDGKGEHTLSDWTKNGPEFPIDRRTSIGLLRQVVKVAFMVGFAAHLILNGR